MTRHVFATSVSGLFWVLVMALCCSLARAQTVNPVPTLDLDRFTGTWYEVAHLPSKRQKNCVRDSVVLVALGDKARSFQLLHACQISKGYIEAGNQDGKAQDKSGDGKLKVSSFWPFSRKVWVLAIGSNYGWSLVGSPNHKTLWILSRTATLKPEVLAEIEARATTEGFSLAKLIVQPEDEQYRTDSAAPAAIPGSSAMNP